VGGGRVKEEKEKVFGFQVRKVGTAGMREPEGVEKGFGRMATVANMLIHRSPLRR
jgi:hypothetical protein